MFLWFLVVVPWNFSGILMVDSHEIECNEKIGNVSTSCTHDEEGNSLTNVTVQSFKTVTKAILYCTVKCAADNNDREYRFEVVNTVIDVAKFVKGAQSNIFLRPLIDSITRSLDFKISFPMPPVNRHDVNRMIENWSLHFYQTGKVQSHQPPLADNCLAIWHAVFCNLPTGGQNSEHSKNAVFWTSEILRKVSIVRSIAWNKVFLIVNLVCRPKFLINIKASSNASACATNWIIIIDSQKNKIGDENIIITTDYSNFFNESYVTRTEINL